MKVQERTGAGNHRSPVPTQPAGERLPSPPRERKPALAALAVLLILVGALGATVLVLRAGERIEVVKITEEIPAGKSVSDSTMTSVMVADDPSIAYVPWEQKEGLKKLQAKNTLVAGTIAIGQMFSDKAGLPEGKAFVGLSLKEGQYPAGLKIGDSVAAYRVGDDAGKSNQPGSSGSSGANALIVQSAKVNDIVKDTGDTISSGNLPVTVMVSSSEVAALTQAASAGQVALVLVPSSSS